MLNLLRVTVLINGLLLLTASLRSARNSWKFVLISKFQQKALELLVSSCNVCVVLVGSALVQDWRILWCNKIAPLVTLPAAFSGQSVKSCLLHAVLACFG